MSAKVEQTPSPSRPTFTLFKSTSSANRCEYIGSVTTPDGRVWAIEANVSEHDRGDGSKGKHFEGQVFGGGYLARQMLRDAKVDGVIPDDLLKPLEDEPYDDPLPQVL